MTEEEEVGDFQRVRDSNGSAGSEIKGVKAQNLIHWAQEIPRWVLFLATNFMVLFSSNRKIIQDPK